MRGVGQVLFCGNVPAGILITAGLAAGDPQLAGLALAGCASATALSRNGAAFGISPEATSAGLMGYNGALVGCAFSVFLSAPLPLTALATVIGGGASAMVASKLAPAMAPVPQWTLAFNITALALLALTQPFRPDEYEAQHPPPPSEDESLEAGDWATSALVGVSQIFVVDNPLAGALMLAGIASYSPMAAGATLLGSVLGAVTAQFAGGDKESVVHGLWGFNPALAALAVSIFFVPTGASAAFAGGAAVVSALCAAAMNPIIRDALHTPGLTLPFCAVASACHIVGQKRALGLRLAKSPHSPEMNLRNYKAGL